VRIEPTPSWLLFDGCLGVGFGIAVASWLTGTSMVLATVVSTVMIGFLVRSLSVRDRFLILAIFIIGLAIGIGRYSVAGPGQNSVANEIGSSAIVEGRIVGADLNDSGSTYVLDSLVIDDVRRDDRIRVEAPISSTASIGDYIRTSCVLEQPQPFDGFAYDRFLAAKSIYAICRLSSAPFVVEPISKSTSDRFWIAVGGVHDWIDHQTRSILPEPQATLLFGLLIGENSFSHAWKEKFQITGTSHIVAASGYNVAIVAEFAMIFFVTIGLYRKQAFPLVVACIGGFVILAGVGGAVVRAGIMGILALTSRHIGRHASPRNILALTIVAMLLFEPRLLRDDVGFQLSVTATIGLILFTDRVSAFLKRIPTTFGLRESLASTLAATVATLPVIVFSFGKVSIVAPLVNVLVLPFVPYAMIFGAASIALSSAWSAIGIWIALPTWAVLATITSVIDAASKIPFAAILVQSNLLRALFIILIAIVFGAIRRFPRTFERELDSWSSKRALIVSGVLVVLFVVQVASIAWRGGRFNGAKAHVFVFDVGQGDAILIDGKDRDIIIDGGPTRFGLLEALSIVRFPWERSVDVVISSHPHSDHAIGLIGLIGTYSVLQVVQSGSSSDASAEALAQAVADSSVPSIIASATMEPWELGNDSTLQILWPLSETDGVNSSNAHDRSVVAKLTVGEESMMFMGDAESSVEQGLVEATSPDPSLLRRGGLGHIDVLKVGHHGSDTSTSDDFLESITPSIAVISVGAGNSYGHPSPFVLGRLSTFGVRTFRTDEQGTIRFDFWKDFVKTSED
jgi:competence protein ComEC